MKRPTFFEGVAVALVASIAGGVLLTLFGPLFAGIPLLRLLIAAIGFAYVLYLLARSRERVGRVTVTATWCVAAGTIWFMAPSLPLYVLAHVGLIWLIRSLYFYSGVLSALADLGLNGLSLAAAGWAMLHSGSVFLALWCFFLVQALFVTIPPRLPGKASGSYPESSGDDHFERAHRAAESAVRKLSDVR